jgi:hypothetical protein
MTLDLFGPLPRGKGNVHYVLVCLDVFSKHVMLYPLKAATTKSCLNKLKSHYFTEINTPKVILSDHGSQFTSSMWKKTLSKLGIQIKYSPIRHPESNPTERVMRELGKYFKIYCGFTHRNWPELIPYILRWLNESVSSVTGYSPIELMYGKEQPDLFEKIIRKERDEKPQEQTVEDKILAAYAKMRLKADKRKKRKRGGTFKWQPQLEEQVLVKCQPVSDASQGCTAKFMRVYEGPFCISKVIYPNIYEVSDEKGKLRCMFNLSHMKPYLDSANVK